MRVKCSVKRLCEGCRIYVDKKVKVKCHLNPRHKQRQRFSTMSPFLQMIMMPRVAQFNPVFLKPIW